MLLDRYVEDLQLRLTVAAEAGGDEARPLPARLTAPLESAVRLTLLDALSAAADEITRELAPGSVELRLRAGEPEFVVIAPAPEGPVEALEAGAEPPPAPAPPPRPRTPGRPPPPPPPPPAPPGAGTRERTPRGGGPVSRCRSTR